ncbi:MAG TPA: serine hydrolase domain-containing protein [Bauldia sp.]|nr:serine hydrolase domain-containing protein [Bauldia sp.]
MQPQGYVAPGYEPVREAFEENFTKRGELGASFAAFRHGEPVVDLWDGVADRATGRPWREDTLQLIYSGTKGMVALCVLMLIDRGKLRLDDPVSRHWPEFGKPEILVRHIVSHTARLPGIEAPITLADLIDDRRMAEILAGQAPSHDPRAALCYHALTYGWLCGELIRRVDGRSVGRFFAEEVAGPLDVEFWIGLPAEHESRVTTLELAPDWGLNAKRSPDDFARDPLLKAVWGNPPVFDRETFFWNERAVHAAEMPGANGIGTARAVAKIYGILASGGAPLLSEKSVRLGRALLAEGYDALHEEYRRFGVGFQLQTEVMNYGPPADAFGHGGAGGSNHAAWPSLGIGYSYAMNLMRDSERPDQRSRALLGALHDCATREAR